MSSHKIYLAGPIAGFDFKGASQWRNTVKWNISPKIQCYSPLRGKEYLSDAGVLHGGDYPESPLSMSKGIMGRDYQDVKRADAIFVNLLGAERVSIGTVIEIAWAYAMQKPVILVMEKSGNIHDHVMVNEAITYRTDDLREGIALCEHLLLPYID